MSAAAATAAASSSTAKAAASVPLRRRVFQNVVYVHNSVVSFFGWRVLIGTPLAFSAAWGGYYYVYYHRPWQLMRARRQISDTAPPLRFTRMYTTGGDNGTGDAVNGDGLVDASIANHSKVPTLEDPRREVGEVDESRLGRAKFQIEVLLRGFQVLIHATPVITLFLFAFFGFVDFQRACTALHDLLCDMGPAFIKLGQWMATRPDLFPSEICETLSNLYDAAPAHSWEETMAILATTNALVVDDAIVKQNVVIKQENDDKTALFLQRQQQQQQQQQKKTENSNINGESNAEGDDGAPVHYSHQQRQTHPSGLVPELYPYKRGTESILHSLEDIDKVPLNSGSVAQVYHARLSRDVGSLKKGTEVAIKVLHPHARDKIWTDVCVLKLACDVVSAIVPAGKYLDPLVHWYEFSSFLISQLNLEREADNLDQFRYNFRNFPLLEFPVPVRELSSPNVLVESYERGYPLKKTPHVSRSMADRGVHVFLKMIFEDNFVHADLHPGNIFLRRRGIDDQLDPIRMTADGKIECDTRELNEIVILDPGLVTSLSPKDRENFILLFAAVTCGDSDLAAQLMMERSPAQSCGDLVEFKKDMRKMFALVTPDTEQNKALGEKGQRAFRLSEVKFGEVLMGLLLTLRKHKVAIDGNFATLVMAAIVGEGMGRAMNPDYNLFAAAAPFLVRSLDAYEIQHLATQLQQKYGLGVVVDLVPGFY